MLHCLAITHIDIIIGLINLIKVRGWALLYATAYLAC